MDGEPAGPSASMRGSVQRLILKNALFLTIAQAASIPLSIASNAAMGRYLGPTALGYVYLGTTFNSFAYMAVDWGQSGALPALVATDRSRAGRLLGTSLVWRFSVAIIVSSILAVTCRLLGYDSTARTAIAILSVGYLASTLVNACQETIIGFERTDVSAVRQFGEQLVCVLLVVPILVAGGKLPVALVGCVSSTVVISIFVWRSLRRVGIGKLSVDSAALRELLGRGTPFVFYSLALILQPNVDAFFLSRLAPTEVIGWLAASRRLIGLLVFPVSALIGALYPTLCRLHSTDSTGFQHAVRGALRGTSLLVVPIALGCGLYPDLGISIFGRGSFAPAEDNLRILAAFLFLMYFTMPLGCSLLAGGRQRAWAIVQSVCVAVSVVLDPILVPWFQRRTGNGGMGVCVASVVSEVIVVICGLFLAPPGIFGRQFWRSLVPILVSGVAMAAVAWLLRPLSPFFAAPVAVGAYAGALWATGGIDKSILDMVGGFLKRKMSERKRASEGA